jgi:hypothetical protein
MCFQSVFVIAALTEKTSSHMQKILSLSLSLSLSLALSFSLFFSLSLFLSLSPFGLGGNLALSP